MKAAIFALVLMLSACADPGNNVGVIEQNCATTSDRFLDQWACTKAETVRRGGMADRRQGHLTRQYITHGDAVAERVRAGTMTEVEAKAEMARLYAEIKRQADADRPVYRPYTPPPPTTITCTTLGRATTCN